MTTIIRATFDGDVFRPSEPVDLAPDTEVQITIETNALPEGEPVPAQPRVSLGASDQQPGTVDQNGTDLPRLLNHAGSINSGDVASSDNDRLDRDLAREYASRHEAEG